MNVTTLRDRGVVKCVLCNVDIAWKGISKIIENHVSKGPHRKKLRRESIHHKRARSIAVKGVSVQTEYYKQIRAVFEKYTGVESTFKFPLNKNGKFIIIVRFFSPDDAQYFLNLKSTWVINGQCATLIPDTFTGVADRKSQTQVRNSPQNAVPQRDYIAPQVTNQNVWAESDKSQKFSNNSYPKYPQGDNGVHNNKQETWSDMRGTLPSTSNSGYQQNELYTRNEQLSTASRNYGSEANNTYSNNNTGILSQSHNYSNSESKTPFVNEYRSVSFDRSEPVTSNYNPNPVVQSSGYTPSGVVVKKPVLYGSHTSGHNDYSNQDRRQQSRDIQPAHTFVSNDNRAGHTDVNYRGVESSNNRTPPFQKRTLDTHSDRSVEHRDSYSNRSVEHRDTYSNRSVEHRDTYSNRSVEHRDTYSNRSVEHRDTYSNRSVEHTDTYSNRSVEHREREGNQTVKKDFRRSDRSRSPIQKDYSRSHEVMEASTSDHNKKVNKKVLPKVTGSLLKGSFNKQVFELLTEINSDVCQFIKVKDVCNDICRSLNDTRHNSPHQLKGASVKPFGCMNLGIGIKGAPLEICIYLPDNLKLQVLQKKSLSFKYYEIIRDILKNNSSLYRNVVLSEDQTTVTFTHIPSKYEVRANILRDAMVLNDELFDIYIESDKRLVSVFVFIIFWAHTHDILQESVFEDHEMILLIIFYLQRLTKPILPPAYMLQVDDGGQNMDNKCLSYWHTTFEVNPKTFPKNENDSDLLTLIEGFFLFYADFSFKNIVISPFSGLTIPTQIFKDVKELPVEFKRYIYLVTNKYVYPLNTDSPICIQDPIKLNRNATITVTPSKLVTFREKCLLASGLMYKFRMKHTEVGLTCALLNLADNTVDHVHKITSEVFTRYPGLLNDNDTLLLSNRLTSLLEDILTNILKVKFTAKKHVNYSKKKILTNTKIVYSCAQYYNLWSSRKIYKSKIPHSSSTLEWEAALSDKVIESVYKGTSCSSPMFEYEVKGYVKRNEKLIQIDIAFKDVEEDFIKGLTTFITPIIDYELKRVSIV